MRRPASAPSSIMATTMPALTEHTPYQSGDAPHASIGSGSAPIASSSITPVSPLCARSNRSRTSDAQRLGPLGRLDAERMQYLQRPFAFVPEVKPRPGPFTLGDEVGDGYPGLLDNRPPVVVVLRGEQEVFAVE